MIKNATLLLVPLLLCGCSDSSKDSINSTGTDLKKVDLEVKDKESIESEGIAATRPEAVKVVFYPSKPKDIFESIEIFDGYPEVQVERIAEYYESIVGLAKKSPLASNEKKVFDELIAYRNLVRIRSETKAKLSLYRGEPKILPERRETDIRTLVNALKCFDEYLAKSRTAGLPETLKIKLKRSLQLLNSGPLYKYTSYWVHPSFFFKSLRKPNSANDPEKVKIFVKSLRVARNLIVDKVMISKIDNIGTISEFFEWSPAMRSELISQLFEGMQRRDMPRQKALYKKTYAGIIPRAKKFGTDERIWLDYPGLLRLLKKNGPKDGWSRGWENEFEVDWREKMKKDVQIKKDEVNRLLNGEFDVLEVGNEYVSLVVHKTRKKKEYRYRNDDWFSD